MHCEIHIVFFAFETNSCWQAWKLLVNVLCCSSIASCLLENFGHLILHKKLQRLMFIVINSATSLIHILSDCIKTFFSACTCSVWLHMDELMFQVQKPLLEQYTCDWVHTTGATIPDDQQRQRWHLNSFQRLSLWLHAFILGYYEERTNPIWSFPYCQHTGSR